MIFVTVGTQLPFDRLIKAVDRWAAENNVENVVVQSGRGGYSPSNCQARMYMTPQEWEELFNKADFIIAHAGMGTILKCLDAQKPLVIMPRQGRLGEHRNEHQVATASRFNDTRGIFIANTEQELYEAVNNIQSGEDAVSPVSGENLNSLIGELRDFAGLGNGNV